MERESPDRTFLSSSPAAGEDASAGVPAPKADLELQAVYDAAPVMIGVVDEERRVLSGNRLFREFAAAGERWLPAGRFGTLIGCIEASAARRGCGDGPRCDAVSYTHLTLPTNREV